MPCISSRICTTVQMPIILLSNDSLCTRSVATFTSLHLLPQVEIALNLCCPSDIPVSDLKRRRRTPWSGASRSGTPRRIPMSARYAMAPSFPLQCFCRLSAPIFALYLAVDGCLASQVFSGRTDVWSYKSVYDTPNQPQGVPSRMCKEVLRCTTSDAGSCLCRRRATPSKPCSWGASATT